MTADSTTFAFTPANLEAARKIVAKYPEGRQQSAVIPLLEMAQRQNGNWLSVAAMDYIAALLEMPPIKAYEVASFYTMFNLKPVGEHLVQVCTTTPCWLRGSDQIVEACKRKLGIDMGETTADGKFTLREVECMGACINAPMVQINDDNYEDLTPESTERILDALASGQKPQAGSQISKQRVPTTRSAIKHKGKADA